MRASFSTDTYSHDKLHVGGIPVLTDKVTLLSGDGARTRGAVMGRKATAATVAAAVASAGNTGNGTVTLNATPFTGRVKAGKYRIVCIEPVAAGGIFAVEDPDGNVLVPKAVVAAEYSNHLVFTINDGATDFVAGDSFTIEVSAITYKYLRSASAATDGSEIPVGILVEAADSTAADVECLVYTRGDFNEGALNFGTGHTADTVREALRARGIYLVKSAAA